MFGLHLLGFNFLVSFPFHFSGFLQHDCHITHRLCLRAVPFTKQFSMTWTVSLQSLGFKKGTSGSPSSHVASTLPPPRAVVRARLRPRGRHVRRTRKAWTWAADAAAKPATAAPSPRPRRREDGMGGGDLWGAGGKRCKMVLT